MSSVGGGSGWVWVDIPPRRYTDYLGFIQSAGQWLLITKLTRVLDGPEL